MKKLLLFATLFFVSLLFSTCSVGKKTATIPVRQTFTFDYKSPSSGKPNAAGIVVGLVKPKYAARFEYSGSDIFVNFRDAFENDLKELIIDKGFTIQNVYPEFANLTYQDKLRADIALDIEIDPRFSTPNGDGWKTYTPFQFSASGNVRHEYGFVGSVSLIGKINITGREPLSHETIWVKSIEIPTIGSVDISTYYRYNEPVFNANFYNDPNVYNSLGAALQKQYAAIFQQLDSYLDPREFTDLKPQIKELKSKKVY